MLHDFSNYDNSNVYNLKSYKTKNANVSLNDEIIIKKPQKKNLLKEITHNTKVLLEFELFFKNNS